MKVTFNMECTPEEARTFLGLPDVSEPNQVYVDALTKAMRTVTSVDELREYAKQIAPVGQMGLKLFQQAFEKGAGAAFAGFAKGRRRAEPDEE